jgi:hypothetical protein
MNRRARITGSRDDKRKNKDFWGLADDGPVFPAYSGVLPPRPSPQPARENPKGTYSLVMIIVNTFFNGLCYFSKTSLPINLPRENLSIKLYHLNEKNTIHGSFPSNSEFTCSKTEKRPDKYTWGPVSGNKEGPFPSLFPLPPPHTFSGLFSARILPQIAVLKRQGKVKKWSNEHPDAGTGAGPHLTIF